ncbi:MFS transporter [Candidatus Thorarchaeota archaeon]|nr:MAG: MFS transporter [Candidatus Thorarchaeota archaeon]
MSRVTKGSYAVLLACIISHFMNHVYTSGLSPFLTVIQTDLGINYTQIGIATSAAIVAMTTAHLLVGYLGDRGMRDIFISISVLLAAVAMLLTSFAGDFVTLTIFQIFLGLGASGYHPSSFPALADKFPKDRSMATGIQAMGGLLGMAVTPFLGVTLFVTFGSWQASLQVLGILGIILFVPTFLLMRYSNGKSVKIEEEEFERTHIIDQEEVICDGADGWTRNFWLLVVLMGLRGTSFRSTSLLMPLYLAVEYSTGLVTAGYLTAVMLTAGLVGEVVSSYYSDRWGRRVPFLMVSTGIATPALLLLNFHLDPTQLVMILIFIGFFFYLGVPANTAYQTEVCPKNSRGLAFGLLFSVGSIPGAISPIIFGIIGDNFGLPASILFLVVTTFLATVVTLFLKDVNTKSANHSKLTMVDDFDLE